MTKQLSRVAPVRAGMVLAAVYGFLSLAVVPVVMLIAMLTSGTGQPTVFQAVAMSVLMPILYSLVGFVGGLFVAVIYNLVARWTGGLQFEVRDVPPA